MSYSNSKLNLSNQHKRPLNKSKKREFSPKVNSDTESYTTPGTISQKLELSQKEQKFQSVIKSVSKERKDITRLLVRLQQEKYQNDDKILTNKQVILGQNEDIVSLHDRS